MKIKFEVADYKSALSRLTKIVTNPDTIFFKASDDTLTLEAQKDGVGASVSIKASVKKAGFFCTCYSVVKTIFNNKSTVSLSLAEVGNKVNFSTGSLSGDFITMESQEYEQGIIPDMVSISESQLAFIQDVLKHINIEEFFFKSPLSVTLKFDCNGACALVSSDFHQVYAFREGHFKDFYVRIPYKNLASIIALAAGSNFNIGITDSAMSVKADSFSCSLSIENAQEDRFNDYIGLIGEVLNHKPFGIIEQPDLKGCMETIMTIADSKASVEMSVTDKKLEVFIKTAKGTIREKLALNKCKRDSEPFSVNPKAVMDLVKNMAPCSYYMIVTDRLVAFTTVTSNSIEYTYLNAMYSG